MVFLNFVEGLRVLILTSQWHKPLKVTMSTETSIIFHPAIRRNCTDHRVGMNGTTKTKHEQSSLIVTTSCNARKCNHPSLSAVLGQCRICHRSSHRKRVTSLSGTGISPLFPKIRCHRSLHEQYTVLPTNELHRVTLSRNIIVFVNYEAQIRKITIHTTNQSTHFISAWKVQGKPYMSISHSSWYLVTASQKFLGFNSLEIGLSLCFPQLIIIIRLVWHVW